MWWGTSLIFYFIYTGKYPLFEQWRSRGSPDEVWPWESESKETWRRMLGRSIFFTLFNTMVSAQFFVVVFEYLKLYAPAPSSIESMPSPFVFACQVIFCMIIEDVAFYFNHRLLHHPKLYPSIHKIHHENKVNYCLAAIHTHPVEYIVGNVFPMIIGPAILWHRMHRASCFGWYFVRICETLEAHSGYSFPFSPFRLLPF